MTNKATKKGKKPLQTTLGKAPGQNEKEVDLSHVRKPIDTSVFGLKQVLSLFNTATEEVKDYITYECDIIYECRICKTIFRSLANFILHKRSFCRDKYIPIGVATTYCITKEPSQPPHPPQSTTNIELRGLQTLEVLDSGKFVAANPTSKGLSPVIAKLKEKQEISRLTQEIINKDFSNEKKDEIRMGAMTNNDLLLEEIATNNAAVFQTILHDMPEKAIGKPELIKSEVMEIHGMLDSDEAVLGADGKICNFQTNKINSNPIIPKLKLVCTECNMQFSTKKTLTFHLKNKHNDTSLVYVCPDCKDTFANSWCVYRHLYKVHRKTSAQVKRLREQVHNSVIRKDHEPHKKLDKKESENLDKTDEENQWLNNIEGDNAFQMCGGCGKRFERKAALHSHATMCIKRIAVCNTIKENNAKKKEEESKDAKTKAIKVDRTVSEGAPMKGASKRKPYLLRTYKTIEKIDQVPDVNDNKIVCNDTEMALESEHSLEDNKDDSPISDIIDSQVLPCIRDNKIVCNDTEMVLGSEHSLGDDKDASAIFDIIDSQALSSIRDFIEKDKNLFVKSENDSEEHSLLKKPETVSEFDLFCKRVLEHLKQAKISKESEKLPSTDGISEHTVTKSDDIFVESVFHAESEPELEMNTSLGAAAVSPCRISIRSLDDLIGFSKEEQEQKTEIPTIKTPSPVRKQSSSPRSPRTPRSPRSPRKAVQRLNKRKRTKSLDLDSKNAKMSDFEAISDDRDRVFMTRAAPYMDGLNLTCKSCQTKYPTLSKLLWHMSAHFSWFRFQCSKCSFITFSKTDCAEHAEQSHSARKSEIGSIVLPIPNWKTALMSNEFRELRNEQEMCGIHTDEVMIGSESGEEAVRDAEEEIHDNIIDTLFIDSDTEKTELADEVIPFPAPIRGDMDFIKRESIDIVDEDKDSFQMEMPDEIYPMDVFEVIEVDNCDNDRYGDRNGVKIKSERRDSDDFVIPGLVNELQPVLDQKVISIKTEDPIINLRPIRNRMRSIKTLQNDFFYDLTGGKASDTAASKANGLPKLKKNGPNACSRKVKGMRVYSKK